MADKIFYGDFSADFPCKCGSPIDVYINWNDGSEVPRCRADCRQFSIKWFCDKSNGEEA